VEAPREDLQDLAGMYIVSFFFSSLFTLLYFEFLLLSGFIYLEEASQQL
jgi:hypothetical protein